MVRSECHARAALELPRLEVDWTRLVDPTQVQARPAPAVLPPGAKVPNRDRWREPEERERRARELGVAVLGEDRRADRILCPACGRRSVFFSLRPYRMQGARCDHRRSCGWAGPLGALCRSMT